MKNVAILFGVFLVSTTISVAQETSKKTEPAPIPTIKLERPGKVAPQKTEPAPTSTPTTAEPIKTEPASQQPAKKTEIKGVEAQPRKSPELKKEVE